MRQEGSRDLKQSIDVIVRDLVESKYCLTKGFVERKANEAFKSAFAPGCFLTIDSSLPLSLLALVVSSTIWTTLNRTSQFMKYACLCVYRWRSAKH
jgi:hypothetical protein